MGNLIYSQVEPIANWRTVGVLAVLVVLCFLVFRVRNHALGRRNVLLDARSWYAPDEAHQLLADLGRSGRGWYRFTEATLDVFFPVVYGTLLCVLIVLAWDEDVARWLVLVPVLAVGMDLLENATVVALIGTFHERASPLAWAGAVFTASKWVLVTLAFLLAIAGLSAKALWWLLVRLGLYAG